MFITAGLVFNGIGADATPLATALPFITMVAPASWAVAVTFTLVVPAGTVAL